MKKDQCNDLSGVTANNEKNPYVMLGDKESVKAFFLTDSNMNEYDFCELSKGIAKTGNPIGQLFYGVCLSMGLGCDEDNRKAIKWWTKAANQGESDAQFNLGNYYYNGYHTRKDYKKAVYWLEKSAKQGNQEAQALLGECYHQGRGVPKNMKKAVILYKKAIDNGNTDPYVGAQLGLCYYHGLGIRKNYQKAFKLLLKGAENDITDAQFIIGVCYANGQGVKTDMETAFRWWLKAAAQGHTLATKFLNDIQ